MCVWIEDADGIDMNEKSLEIVYQNERVKNFLNSRKVLGISGIKGQGKTFLLKVKRSKAEKSESVECFPKNIMVDQLDSSIVIEPSIQKYMEDFTKWVAIWKIAISMTIIRSNVIGVKAKNNFINNSPEVVQDLFLIKDENYRPSVYVNHLLKMKRKKLKEVIDFASDLLEILYGVHQAVYVFIDKIDQAFATDIHRIWGDSRMSRGPRNASYWQYSQYALANAAYDIFSNSNHHIKIYYSIRQEALIDTNLLAPNLKRNIESYIVNLEYSKKDLKAMFDMYVNNEEDNNLNLSSLKESNPIKAFLGIDKIENRHISQEENAFDYIYRHSLKRPSDIMRICKKLSLDNKNSDISRVRTIVNECAGDILNMYISELSPFLPYNIKDMFFHINTNILSFEYIKYICNRFTNQNRVKFSCTHDCLNCKIVHPFSVLYNLGLLGYIKDDIANGIHIQSFNRIGGSVFLENIIQFPKSNFYFIHPCLMDVVRRERDTCGLKHFTSDCCIVGDGYLFLEDSEKDVNEINQDIADSRYQLSKENVFISSTIEDLHDERETIKNALYKRGYASLMSEKNSFPIDANKLNYFHSHDYCLDQLMDCGSLISVIGKQYGGEYSGDNYINIRDEIIELSEGRIEKPSISLMEYYLAVKRGIPHYSFISIEYDNQDMRKETWDNKVINEYNFLTHLKKDGKISDNWISRYENLKDLEMRMNNLILP
jgi:hypothetical protein